MTVADTPSSLNLLDPRALAAVSRMELVAKTVMDGYVQGMHKSPHIGFALDFAQHRQYVPGDDIKRIDWRVYAKADRYYIKQYEVTTNLRAHLVVDCSGSMKYRGQRDAMSKYRYAQFVTTCLAYLVLHQQDSVGLVTFDTQIAISSPRGRPRRTCLPSPRLWTQRNPAANRASAPFCTTCRAPGTPPTGSC